MEQPLNTANSMTVSYAVDNRSGLDSSIYDSLGMPALNFEDETVVVGATPNTISDLDGTAGETNIALSWTAPVAVVPAIYDYEVDYKLSTDASWTTFSDGSGTTASVNITGLTSGTEYDFRVRAVNDLGNGDYVELLNQATTQVEEEEEEEEDDEEDGGSITLSGSYAVSRVGLVRKQPMTPTQQPAKPTVCLNKNTGLMKFGNRGQEVSRLQQNLLTFGLDPGPIDGIFGNRTLTGVKKYQQMKGLIVDGLVGNQTKTSMNANCGA